MEVRDTLLGEAIQVAVDLVVLATGYVPNAPDNSAVRSLRDAQGALRRNESEARRAEAEKSINKLRCHEGTEVLNLAYRQGPDLPLWQEGFPGSNFVCFPYETLRTGIYAAGAVRAPMDAARAEEDAGGAAMKAIQFVEMASRGQAAHPRAGDLSYPIFALQRCTQCKRCTEECPFGSLDEDEKGTPKFNAYRCRRCGVCMGACPERIISFKNYSVDMIASTIKAIEVPEEEEEDPRVLLFMCENDAYPALDVVGLNRLALQRERTSHSTALPGIAEYRLDCRRAVARDRRRAADGMQVRRRLPVPLCQRQRNRQPALGECEGDPAAAAVGVRADRSGAVLHGPIQPVAGDD